MDFNVIIIIVSLIGLIAFAYRGFSVIMMAPIMALLAAAISGLHIMPAYTELFMGKAVTYIKSFFPIFMLGAIFGKVMEDTGLARSIARSIIKSGSLRRHCRNSTHLWRRQLIRRRLCCLSFRSGLI